jgi:hypothetical protein
VIVTVTVEGEDLPWVLAVAHTKRDPEYWQNRLQ